MSDIGQEKPVITVEAMNEYEQELYAERRGYEIGLAEVDAQLAVVERIRQNLLKRVQRSAADSKVAKIPMVSNKPIVRLADALKEATQALPQFTRDTLAEWVHAKYPQLEFKSRSVTKPLRDLIISGNVVMIQKNIGAKSQAVYRYNAIKNLQ